MVKSRGKGVLLFLGDSIGWRLSWFAQWNYGSFFDDIKLFEVGNLMALTRAFVANDHCRMHIPWSFLAEEQLGCSARHNLSDGNFE